ncbi:hypothetical protein MKW92_027853, partial [Papaver armeniacum]
AASSSDVKSTFIKNWIKEQSKVDSNEELTAEGVETTNSPLIEITKIINPLGGNKK